MDGLYGKKVIILLDEYDTPMQGALGFTQAEVFAALEECGLSDKQEEVKRWYDGFIFGMHKDIYNPWSILNFWDTGKITTYWANTSANSLVGRFSEKKQYAAQLEARGITKERIRSYGFAFQGNKVLIG